jgi:NADPH:quinone reductase-like Zn-dependent oxidoreductase
MSVRAVVVSRPGGVDALEVAALERRPLRPEEVRVGVHAAGVNPVDAENRADPLWAGLAAPYVVGYECAGAVLEAGAAVEHLRVGDEVWLLLPVRGTQWGTYAEEVVCDATLVEQRPASLDPIEAAVLPLAGLTALQLLDRLAPRTGDWLLVHGAAGGVGHLLVQLAHTRGCRIAAPARQERHEFLHALGVDVVVDRFAGEPLRTARDAAGEDFACVADLVGGGSVAASLPFVAKGGSVASIVELAGDFEEAIDRNVTLHGVLARPGRLELQRLALAVEEARLRPELDEVFPLEEARRAHERLERRSGQGKTALAIRTP